MGIDRLAAAVKGRVGRESLAGKLRGKRLAVDASIMITAALKGSPQASAEVHQKPAIPTTVVATIVINRCQKLIALGASLVVVFDGITDHVLKARGVGQSRRKTAMRHQQELEKALAAPVPGNRKELSDHIAEINRWRKLAARITPSVMVAVAAGLKSAGTSFIVAPFEADHQCVYLFEQKMIDGIVTNDIDLWAAGKGGAYLIMNIGWGKMDAHIVDENRLKQGETEKKLKHISPSEGIVMATILGCDYLPGGITNVGAKTYDDVKARARARYPNMEKEFRSTNLLSHEQKVAFEAEHKKLKDAFHHMPVWSLQFVGGKPIVDGIVPLSQPDSIATETFWIEKIGFDPTKKIYEKAGDIQPPPSHQDIAEMDWIASKGIYYKDAVPKPPTNKNDEEMPFGSVVDFEQCRPEYQPARVLNLWLSVRGFIPRKRHNVIKIIHQIKNRDDIPVMTKAQADAVLPKNRRYCGYEMIVPVIDSVTWTTGNHAFSEIRKAVKPTTELQVSKMFGLHNGVRRRALKWVRNGHYYYDSVRCARVMTKAWPGSPSRKLLLVRSEVMSSQRKKVYTTHLAFDVLTGNYFPAPYSRCRCAAGSLFCAHMLGLCLIVGEIRCRCTLSVEELLEKMPTHIEKAQRVVTPVKSLYKLRSEATKK